MANNRTAKAATTAAEAPEATPEVAEVQESIAPDLTLVQSLAEEAETADVRADLTAAAKRLAKMLHELNWRQTHEDLVHLVPKYEGLVEAAFADLVAAGQAYSAATAEA